MTLHRCRQAHDSPKARESHSLRPRSTLAPLALPLAASRESTCSADGWAAMSSDLRALRDRAQGLATPRVRPLPPGVLVVRSLALWGPLWCSWHSPAATRRRLRRERRRRPACISCLLPLHSRRARSARCTSTSRRPGGSASRPCCGAPRPARLLLQRAPASLALLPLHPRPALSPLLAPRAAAGATTAASTGCAGTRGAACWPRARTTARQARG